MANTITRATARRQILRRRLDARYPLFADEFYARDLGQHRAYYAGQAVPAPSHPRRRRRRPARRPIDRKAVEAFRARQLNLLAWRRPARFHAAWIILMATVWRILRKVRRSSKNCISIPWRQCENAQI